MTVSKKIFQYILDRFMEPSTWRGLILVITSLISFVSKKEYAITTEQLTSIITVGIFLSGIIGMMTVDNKDKSTVERITEIVNDVGQKSSDIDANSTEVAKTSIYKIKQ